MYFQNLCKIQIILDYSNYTQDEGPLAVIFMLTFDAIVPIYPANHDNYKSIFVWM